MVNDEIREITRRFVEALHPEKVILFGSYAKDTYREDSDYDFYIVMPDDCKSRMTVIAQGAYHSLWGMDDRKSVDLLVGKESIFEDRATATTMERTIKSEGVVLYDRINEYS